MKELIEELNQAGITNWELIMPKRRIEGRQADCPGGGRRRNPLGTKDDRDPRRIDIQNVTYDEKTKKWKIENYAGTTIGLPAKFIICPECEGHGHTGNKKCFKCKGLRVIQRIDTEGILPEWIKAIERWQEMADHYAEEAP